MGTLWRLVLDAPEAVSAEARALLVALHTQLGGSIGDHGATIRAAFLRCGAPSLPAIKGFLKDALAPTDDQASPSTALRSRQPSSRAATQVSMNRLHPRIWQRTVLLVFSGLVRTHQTLFLAVCVDGYPECGLCCWYQHGMIV